MFSTDLHEEIGLWTDNQVIQQRELLEREREIKGRNPRVMEEQRIVADELTRRGIK
jgi:hypothetical protein